MSGGPRWITQQMGEKMTKREKLQQMLNEARARSSNTASPRKGRVTNKTVVKLDEPHLRQNAEDAAKEEELRAAYRLEFTAALGELDGLIAETGALVCHTRDTIRP